MIIRYQTLRGQVNKPEFLVEWKNSEGRKATYLQTKDNTLYMMPYGNRGERGDFNDKFTGSFRRHIYVARDFEITDAVIGGGYLILSKNEHSCSHGADSKDFDAVIDRDLVVKLVNKDFFEL